MNLCMPAILASDSFLDIAVGGGIAIAIIAIVFSIIRSIMVTRARERTKREVAAYVAEGSMSADDAAKLIKADDGMKACN